MFRATVLLSLATLSLGLASGDLRVTLRAGAASVSSVDDIVISAVVSNPTDQDIRVIAKNNVLDTSATRSFVVSKDGKDVLFAGIRATYDLTAEGVYTTIPAGSSVAVNHTNLGPLYDFETSGTGRFTFTATNIFQTAPDTPALVVDAPPVIVQVTDDVQKRPLLSPSLSTPTCSDAGKLAVIRDSLAGARAMAGGAATDIRTHPTSSEFTTYFGGNSQDEIWWRMDIIAGDLASSGTRIIGCTDPAGICGGTGGVIAYTLVVTSGGQIVGSDIYTCPIFFTAVSDTPRICTDGFDSTTSSKAGVILHELSHATAGTSDLGYGCSVTAGLSTANKLNNADNYRCMGSAIYRHYNC
ncbi:putative secreted metalloproteinase that allows assimilation of proteinaceous substrates [Lyophyllum shimeji]|uniref:Secreted metalloproteinase that allows assimilation of proteinaceous substrates n=1 Tax=Lyophyllum shimeji TaxID=47721 RepID=A0A9P3UNF3_LYOSH|nr:putative secreted metalloproteinase that allows assimilation of proteinaceous substrates [Lyophyllum shimeji]